QFFQGSLIRFFPRFVLRNEALIVLCHFLGFSDVVVMRNPGQGLPHLEEILPCRSFVATGYGAEAMPAGDGIGHEKAERLLHCKGTTISSLEVLLRGFRLLQ